MLVCSLNYGLCHVMSLFLLREELVPALQVPLEGALGRALVHGQGLILYVYIYIYIYMYIYIYIYIYM